MSVSVNGHSFGSGKISWTVARLSKRADEIAVGIENLYSVIQGIRHVEVSFLVHGNAPGPGKIPWRCQRMLFSSRSDPAEQLQRIGVIHQNLNLFHVGDVEK